MTCLIFIILLAHVSSIIGQNVDISGVNLFLFKGSNKKNFSWDSVQQFLTTDYDNTKNSVIFIHGWGEDLTVPAVSGIVNSFSKKSPQYNIFALDWSNYSKGNYVSAVWNVPKVANFLGQNFQKMRQIGYDFDKFHLIGFSLGAHLCGYIGRYMQNSTNYSLPRITGLDPALPLFFPNIFMNPLNSSDARFVDIIHTNSKETSILTPIGHVDFYPNGGKHQPGCSSFPFSNCSHQRSWQLFAESVTYQESDEKFKALKCSNYNSFLRSSCQGVPIYNYMGYYANPNYTGTFYLTISSQPPYSF